MFLEIDSNEIPEKNTKIIKDNKEAGFITSASFSPKSNKVIAFGFLKKEFYEKNKFEVNGSKAVIETL